MEMTTLEIQLKSLSKRVHENPEIGFEEKIAVKTHIDLLKEYGFKITENLLGCETAFKAEFDNGQGPTVAYMSEYDALPEIGHACGHNLIGMIGTGAAIKMSRKMLKDGIMGKVVVFGTPAEETSGFKVELAGSNELSSVDVCLMAHPGDGHYPSGTSLAMDAVEFEFFGKTSHAAASPEKGINALDAVISTFNNINALRQQTSADARIHGVINNGGVAPNIIPEYTSARFYVRAGKRAYLNELTQRVVKCAEAGAMASGASMKSNRYEYSYDDLLTNQVLNRLYIEKAMDMGVDIESDSRQSYGSLDVGNVSYAVPTIHPYFQIAPKGTAAHTIEFAQAAASDYAHGEAMKVLDILVDVSEQFLQSEALRSLVLEEFLSSIKAD